MPSCMQVILMRYLLKFTAAPISTTFMMGALIAHPAAATVYMRSNPPQSLTYFKLAALAAPHEGTNQTGTALALLIDPGTAEGFRVIRSGLSSSREGNRVTIDLDSMTIAGSHRLYGTLRGARLSLDIPADSGEIAQETFTTASEAEWNQVAARFKSFARYVRFVQVLVDQRAAAYKELTDLKAADDRQTADLADLGAQLGPARERQKKVDQQQAQAKASLASGERKHEAAKAVAEAADELAEASRHCGSVGEARDAEEQVKAAGATVADVAAHIRADAETSLARLADIQHRLEARARVIKSASPDQNEDYDVRSAAYDVGSAAHDVHSAAYDVGSAVYDLKSECWDANSEAEDAHRRVNALEGEIDTGRERQAQLRQQFAVVLATYQDRDKRLRTLPRRPPRW
jgi:hypothetical protein